MTRVLLITLGFLALGQVGRCDDAKAAANSHLGQWRQVAVVVDGKEIAVGPSTVLTVTPEGYTVTVDGQPYQSGTTKADRSKSPVESEVTVTEGSLAGRTLLQISKIEGDVLIACIGADRPKEFKSNPGSGHTLSVWIRVK